MHKKTETISPGTTATSPPPRAHFTQRRLKMRHPTKVSSSAQNGVNNPTDKVSSSIQNGSAMMKMKQGDSRLLAMIGKPRLGGLLFVLFFTAGGIIFWWCNLYAPHDMVKLLEDSNVNVESSPSSSNNQIGNVYDARDMDKLPEDSNIESSPSSSSSNHQIGILYLYVDSWKEGVSSWMLTVQRIIIPTDGQFQQNKATDLK